LGPRPTRTAEEQDELLGQVEEREIKHLGDETAEASLICIHDVFLHMSNNHILFFLMFDTVGALF